MTTSRYATFAQTMAILSGHINPVVAAPPAYPFVGQKAVKARLESEYEIQEAAVAMLFHLQTESEQNKRDTEVKNRAGFMSSDAWHGTKIAEKLVAGEELDGEEQCRVAKIACKYSKQLTTQLRLVAMTADPKLASYAAVFSIRG